MEQPQAPAANATTTLMEASHIAAVMLRGHLLDILAKALVRRQDLLVIAVRRWHHDAMNRAYLSAIALALAAAGLLVWLSLGVGIIGADGDPANFLYFGVLAVGLCGALIARFRSRGMARALFASAIAQAVVAAIALVAGLGLPWSPPLEIILLNAFFVALFVASGWLFLLSARGCNA